MLILVGSVILLVLVGKLGFSCSFMVMQKSNWSLTLWFYMFNAVVEFYRNLGFQADPEGIKGMFWYPNH